MSERIDFLRDAFRRGYDVESEHVDSVPIRETFNGETVWEGVVDVFNLQGYNRAKIGYGWQYQDDYGDTQYATVLAVPPVNSPLDAVRAFIRDQASRA